MSQSPPSRSDVGTLLPLDSNRQERVSFIRRIKNKLFSFRLLFLAVLIIPVLGYTNAIPPAIFGPVDRSNAPPNSRIIAAPNPGTSLTWPAISDPGFAVTPTPTLSRLTSFDKPSNAAPLILQQLSLSLEPTTHPTEVINHGPTPTPIPTINYMLSINEFAKPASHFVPASDIPFEPDDNIIESIAGEPTATPTPIPTATQQPTATLTPTPTPTIEAGVKYVIIISIDGLRPDALAQADTPNMDILIKRGSYCPHAQTLSLSITLPSHASMLSGMLPEKHGIQWGLPYIGWPGMEGPTLFTEVHDAGLSTAMVFGKEKLSYIALPNSVDKIFGPEAHDTEIKNEAIKFIEDGLPNAFFIHFPDTDRVGHAYGWMSTNQLFAITFVDGLISEIVSTLKKEGYWDNTLLIITSDHGGQGFNHGDDSPLDRTIPWLAVGPGVARGITLNITVNTVDTAATALYALKLPIPEKWDGRPVLEIFQESESILAASK